MLSALETNGQCPEYKVKDHIRSINKISVSRVVENYCITGSADGDMRAWVRPARNSVPLRRKSHSIIVILLALGPSNFQ